MKEIRLYRTDSDTSSYNDRLLESLTDKGEAIAYLKVALEEYEEDHDTEVFMLALRNVAQAYGGISKLSEKTKLNREHLLFCTLIGPFQLQHNGSTRFAS